MSTYDCSVSATNYSPSHTCSCYSTGTDTSAVAPCRLPGYLLPCPTTLPQGGGYGEGGKINSLIKFQKRRG